MVCSSRPLLDGHESTQYVEPCMQWHCFLSSCCLPHLQVLLRLPEGEDTRAVVYASSWWDAAHVSDYLKDTSRPIWESLSQGRTELYREIQQVYCGHSAFLEE